MTKENEAGVSLEEARNTAENLFGDAVAASNAELGKELEVTTEPDQNQQGSDLAEEEQAIVAETTPLEDLNRNYPYQAAWVQARYHPRREPS